MSARPPVPSPEHDIVDRLAGAFAGDPATHPGAAWRLLCDTGWVAMLLAPMWRAIADDPAASVALAVRRDAMRTSAVLFENPAVIVTATILSADALAVMPPPATISFPGRLAFTRIVRSGGARMDLWYASEADETGAGTERCRPLATIALTDGMVLRLDGRVRGWRIARASCDPVLVTITLRHHAAPFARDFALPGGALLRRATLDQGAARAQLLLALLRACDRRDAAPAFAAASRDRAFFLRWSAMREWLVVDPDRALPRLRDMARADPNVAVRRAASRTLAALPCHA